MMIKADGFDAAIVGQVYDLATSSNRLIYSVDKCVDILVNRDDMDTEEALEYIEFNVSGAYVGDGTPLFMYDNS